MPEIIIKFPYKQIVLPQNCCHCGSYDVSSKVDAARPSPHSTNMEREGAFVIKKSKRINAALNLCKKCENQLKNKKRIYTFSTLSILAFLLITIWFYALPSIYMISQEYKGYLGGFVFFFLGIFSIFLIFLSIIIPAVQTNKFLGMQILAYNPRKIIIRFYNKDLAQKFFDLNDIAEDQVIKRKD